MYYGNSFNCGRIRTGRAVLVAISIPIFTSQLEKSRDAVSISNIRAAYAEAQTAVLTGSSSGNATLATGFDTGAITGDVNVSGVAIKSKKADSWNGEGADLPFTAPTDGGTAIDSATVTFKYVDGAITECTYK